MTLYLNPGWYMTIVSYSNVQIYYLCILTLKPGVHTLDQKHVLGFTDCSRRWNFDVYLL